LTRSLRSSTTADRRRHQLRPRQHRDGHGRGSCGGPCK
jgi:hypothetical protein